MLMTWLLSLGTGAATNGIFFITERRFGFTSGENLALGVWLGASYIAAALAAGPAVRALTRRTGLSSRGALGVVIAVSGASCFVPMIWPTPVSAWIFVGVYSALAGALWPLMESFISGGRSGESLRRATGKFNMAWASAVWVAFVAMSPLMGTAPLAVLGALGVVHAVCVPMLALIGREPGTAAALRPGRARRHAGFADADALARAKRLCVAFRFAMLMSYVLISAVTPMYPDLLGRLGVSAAGKTLLASVWMGTRVGMFVLMERWHGWHGRWSPLWWASVFFAVGLALSMAPLGAAWFVAALAAYGVAQGALYAGAFHYAMEVGEAKVDAGGVHEALIGTGYMVGPLAALVVLRLLGA